MDSIERYKITGKDNQYQLYHDHSIGDIAYLVVILAINSNLTFERFQFILNYQSFDDVFE